MKNSSEDVNLRLNIFLWKKKENVKTRVERKGIDMTVETPWLPVRDLDV